MFAAKGADVLQGLLTNGIRRGRKITGALTRSSFAIYSKHNVSSKVIIIYFIRQYI
jgi:hypothetical protein